MTQSSINTEKVQEALDHLTDVHGKLTQAKETTEATIHSVRQSWESSEASPLFQKVIAEWAAKHDQLLQDTKDMMAYLQSAIHDYRELEQLLAGGPDTTTP